MTSERSKRCDFLSLIFILKSISKKLLIKILQTNLQQKTDFLEKQGTRSETSY